MKLQMDTTELIKALDKLEPLDTATPYDIHQYLVSASLIGIIERLDRLIMTQIPFDPR